MARYRTIKPDFWTSEQIVECSPIARLLFVGLWNFCDDGGVHPDSAKKIKMEVFPADDMSIDDINNMLDELVAADLLQRFEDNDKQYLWVTGWHHQKIDRPSLKYPSPNDRRTLDDNTSSPDPRKGKGSVKESNKTLGRNSKNNMPSDWQDRFDEFRTAYPSRGRATNPVKPAREKFAKLIRDGTDPQAVVAGARGYATAMAELSHAGTERVKQMTTFLNQAVWEQYQPGAAAPNGANGRDPPRPWERAHREATYQAQFPGGEGDLAVATEITGLVDAGDQGAADQVGTSYLEQRKVQPS
jgi:hypothetical protein